MNATTITTRTAWTRDELILAIDLYRRIGAKPDETDEDVIELSRTLRALAGNPIDATVRSPEAVSMKLRNLVQFDTSADAKGLVIASTLAGVVWNEVANDETRRMSEVARITAGLDVAPVATSGEPLAPVTETVTPHKGMRVAFLEGGRGRVAYDRAGFSSVVVERDDGARVKVSREAFVRDETGVIYAIATTD